MRKTAIWTAVDNQSLTQYAIDGIDDDSVTKVILYGAKSLNESKYKLKSYEIAREKFS